MSRIVDLRKGKKVVARARPLPPATEKKRPTPLRARRRRVKAIVALSCAVMLLALAYGVHLVSYAPMFNVQNVTVSGVEQIEPDLIESYVLAQLNDGSFHFLSRSNILLYPKEVIEKGIVASFPRVKDVVITRPSTLSQQLQIAVGERHPYALWCRTILEGTPETCYAVDDGGYIFAESATSSHGEFETAYRFSGGIDAEPIGQHFISGQLPGVLSLLRILQQETDFEPTHVEILPDQDYLVKLAEGFAIKASFGQDAAMLGRNLELILASEALRDHVADLEYIDLRFGNRVYYKLKGEEQVNI